MWILLLVNCRMLEIILSNHFILCFNFSNKIQIKNRNRFYLKAELNEILIIELI